MHAGQPAPAPWPFTAVALWSLPFKAERGWSGLQRLCIARSALPPAGDSWEAQPQDPGWTEEYWEVVCFGVTDRERGPHCCRHLTEQPVSWDGPLGDAQWLVSDKIQRLDISKEKITLMFIFILINVSVGSGHFCVCTHHSCIKSSLLIFSCSPHSPLLPAMTFFSTFRPLPSAPHFHIQKHIMFVFLCLACFA